MARKKRPIKYPILIVCEGEQTEPKYFDFLKPLAIEAWKDTFDLVLNIKPKPNLEDDEAVKKPSKIEEKRRKRQLKNKPFKTPKNPYDAQPIRYVKEAQEGLEDGAYAEIWAVFDKDEHPEHQKAFAKANEVIEGKIVNIAFSSVAFEHWLLLHFEKNQTAFNKSECREGKQYFDCGTGNHSKDCGGSKCIIGYLKKEKYLPKLSKKLTESEFNLLYKNLTIALENAAWLRYKMENTQPIYQLNPYTTVDKLVKRLLNKDIEIRWIDFNSIQYVEEINIKFEKIEPQKILLELTNNRSQTAIFNQDQISIKTTSSQLSLEPKQLLIKSQKTESIEITLPNEAKILYCTIEKYELILSLQ